MIWNAINGANKNEIYIVGRNGRIKRFNGTSWIELVSGTIEELISIFIDVNRVTCLGYGTTIISSTDGGSMWASVDPATEDLGFGKSFDYIDKSKSSNPPVICYSGAMLSYKNGKWYNSIIPIPMVHLVKESASPRSIKGVGKGKNIKFNPDGTGVKEIDAEVTNNIAYVYQTSPHTIFGCGLFGELCKWVDGNIVVYPPITDLCFKGIWGSSDTDVWCVGQNGLVVHWDGTSWTKITSPVSVDINGIWGSAGDNIYAVGLDALLHYDGVKWTASSML